MSRIIGKTLFHKLTPIETEDKELHSPLQRMDTAGKTPRAACQTSQIMTQFSIATFDRKSICLAIRNFITTGVIPKAIIGVKSIAMILFCFDGFVYHVLDNLLCTFPDHFVAQKTACSSIYDGDDVDLLFFSPMKVKSSSISASLTSVGTGALGKLAAFSLTHRDMVR